MVPTRTLRVLAVFLGWKRNGFLRKCFLGLFLFYCIYSFFLLYQYPCVGRSLSAPCCVVPCRPASGREASTIHRE